MSWLDRITNNFTIRTGDGTVYTPSWINATTTEEWNIAEFNFPEVDGTLIKKSKKRGNKYNTELYFQGEDHLDISEAFSRSAKVSNKPWVIMHPLYGQIYIQMGAFTKDNTQMNVTKISGVMAETILEDFPQSQSDPAEEIINQKLVVDEMFVQSLDSIPSPADSNQLTNDVNSIYKNGAQIVPNKEFGEEYFNLYNMASAAIINLTSSPIQAMRQTQAMVNLPFQFEVSVKNRIDCFVEQFQATRRSLPFMKEPSPKKIYQILSSAIISSMCATAATPQPGNYPNKQSVYNAINAVITTYNTFIDDLTSIQTSNNGTTSSFVPNFEAQKELNNLINKTISTLFNIALGAKQERSYICEQDTNIILLTHRFLGLVPESNIDVMLELNDLGLNEMLVVKKGRKIIYYV